MGDARIKTILIQQVNVGQRAMVAGLLCLAIMLVDDQTDWLTPVRTAAGVFLYPIHELAYAPMHLSEWSKDTMRSRSELQSELERVTRENLYLESRLQKYASLKAENSGLRDLLGSTAQLDLNVLVGEVVGIDPDPYRDRVMINKGTVNNVYQGQPVLDANGLLGQVVEVDALASRVLLLTDVLHAVPVRVLRSSALAVAVGAENGKGLTLLHVSQTADVRKGDLLVTSGLAERFPRGYPVAEVTVVESQPGSPYMHVEAMPLAAVESVSYVLFVDMGQSEQGIDGKSMPTDMDMAEKVIEPKSAPVNAVLDTVNEPEPEPEPEPVPTEDTAEPIVEPSPPLFRDRDEPYKFVVPRSEEANQ